MIRVNLTHTGKKPQTTIITINGTDLIEVNTHASKLHFIKNKIGNSSGKMAAGEYWFEEETQNELS